MMAIRVSSLLGRLKQPSFGIYALLPGRVNKGCDCYFCTHAQTLAPPIFYNYTYCSCAYVVKKSRNKYKNNWIKLKDEVGMAMPKSTQTRFVGIILTMTNVTTETAWLANISTCSCQTLGFIIEAFTGRARAIPRCSYCLDDNHHVNDCPKTPSHSFWDISMHGHLANANPSSTHVNHSALLPL